jgi:23S rRNA (adenine2030-N6)-methyltransferase
LAGSTGAKALAIDGWTALSAYLPPKERRGLVFVDPPFEAPDEFARLAAAFAEAQRKWASGIYLLWYPIKDRSGPDALAKRLRRPGINKILRAELMLSRRPDANHLNGCGLIIVNPPWTLEDELAVLLPALVACLSQCEGGFYIDWLAREN